MIRVLSVAETKHAERMSGEAESELIKRAAAALHSHFTGIAKTGSSVAVLAGIGNNGADALEFARLAKDSYAVTIVRPNDNHDAVDSADYILDGLLGTGCNRITSGSLADLVRRANAAAGYKIAIDIPSGLNADTGRAMGDTLVADQTVTFGSYKAGQLIGEGRNYCGKITVCDIGLPSVGQSAWLITQEDAALPKRQAVSHKGNYGRVSVIGGSGEMPGGVLLSHESALASLRGGAGYATLCVPRSLAPAYQCRVREELLRFLPDNDGKIVYSKQDYHEIADSSAVVVIGMGLGENEHTAKIIQQLAGSDITLIIDADGLNAVSRNLSCILGRKCRLILTPHVGEFRRLCGNKKYTDDIAAVREMARELDCVIVMKSATTIISDGQEVYLNTTGSPAMAKAGSGDVLAGLLGGLAAQFPPLKAAILGCYHFGKAGERAAADLGEYSVLASDLIRFM